MMQPDPHSEKSRQPWLALGISRRTYYARKHERSTPVSRERLIELEIARTVALVERRIQLARKRKSWLKRIRTARALKRLLVERRILAHRRGLAASDYELLHSRKAAQWFRRGS